MSLKKIFLYNKLYNKYIINLNIFQNYSDISKYI